MKISKNKPAITVEAQKMRLNVVRVGKSMRLKNAVQASSQSVRYLHSHFTYEVFFITEGSLTLVTDGASATYEGKVVIIPPRTGHYTLPQGDGCFCLLFSFEKSKDSAQKTSYLKALLEQGICTLPMTEDVSYYIRAIARKSEGGLSENSERDVFLLTSLLFEELMRALQPEDAGAEPIKASSKHIAAIEAFVNSNYRCRITLSDVASHVYLSPRQVSRILQREYGSTLSALVTEKRLAQAKMLLKNTDQSVGKIALDVGIGSENYFFALFKKRYGITPLKYRNVKRNGL